MNGRATRALALLALSAVAIAGCAGRPAASGGVSSLSEATFDEGGAAAPRAVLKWTARSERGVYGYLIYRAASESGPYLRVNREILHVDPDRAPGPSGYEYEDFDVAAGGTYYYYLATVGDDGKKRRFSSVIAKSIPGP